MKKIIILICLLFLYGCTDYVEINDLGIITGIGIDYKNNLIEVTTQMLINDKETEVKVYDTKAKTIEKALAEISKISNKNIFLSDLKILLITENIIKNEINYYDFFLRNTKSKMNFSIAIVDSNEINDILNIYNKKDGSSLYVDKMMKFNEDIFSSSKDLEFIELVQTILEYGINPIYPKMTIKRNNNENVLYLDSLVSYNKLFKKTELKELESIFYNILSDTIDETILSIGCEEEIFSISLNNVDTNYSFVNNMFKVDINSTSQLYNYECDYDLDDNNNVKKIENIINNYIENNSIKLINKSKDNNNDFIGFGNHIYKYHNKHFDFKNDNWDNYIKKIDFKVSSNNKISTSGEIRGLIGDKYEKNK